ncbi:MAG TPA: FkbM family methyltransferase [Candidatus Acidoferrum sp.]|nr:FkbM family methyltransferase [Candidatus Acidoferrum sp.]
MPRLKRLAALFLHLIQEWRACVRLCADPQSALQLGLDFALSRFLPWWGGNRVGRLRNVRLQGGVELCYRLNKGDLHSIREVWFDEAYRLPFGSPSGTLLDLGANIGLTSVWLAKKYPFERVIAVEPDRSNAILARRNLDLNAIKSEVLEAAIGPHEGTVGFDSNQISNLGRVSENGLPVAMITVDTILEKSACPKLALVKIDIEGGEQELFDGSLGWLDRTDAIIIEFHPAPVDPPKIIKTVEARGFTFIRSNSAFPGNMDYFKRGRRS